MVIIKRFFNLPEDSFFVFGPRGTGKSTWLKLEFPEAIWIDLLNPEELRLYSAYPERLREIISASQKKDIVIDEVQKIPELLNVVHSLIEKKQGWRFILTGSSSRKLKRAGVNLLAGRAVVRYLHPFIAAELGSMFDLDKALQYGLLPLIYLSNNPEDTLRSYIGLYLKEEVQTEGLVRNIGDFARFLEVISFSHGSILNITNIARECLVSRKLVEGYLSVLQDLLLCHLLPVFTRRAKREIIVHPKFYYFDAGVFRSLRMQGPLDSAAEITGITLEGLVLQHLVAWRDYKNLNCKIYYWRTRHGVEVDFIIYGEQIFYAIEVKNSKNINVQDIKGLETFGTDYPEAKLILLYRGDKKLRIRNVICVPVTDFLSNLHPAKDILPNTFDS